MKPYPAYKPTGLAWLPEVPREWEMLRLGMICSQKSIVGQTEKQLLSVYLNKGVVPFSSVDEKRTNATSESLDKYQLVEPGDFVLNNQQAWRGSVGVSDYEGIVSPAYFVLSVSTRMESRFANYLFRDNYMVSNYVISSKGIGSIQRNLDWRMAKDIRVPVPPSAEQEAIVAYLDEKTAKIDRLIELKEREIKLLNEKKQAVISKVVTRGLDPNAELVDGDVPGWPKIPKHWQRKSLKTVLDTPMCDGPHTTPSFVKEGVPFVSAEGAHDGRVFVKDCRGLISRELHEEYCKRLKPQKGDIFIVKSGSTTGKTVMVDVDDEFSVWSPLALVRVGEKIDARYLFNFLTSVYFQREVQDNWSFGTQPNIGMGVLKNLYVLVPPREEQVGIVRYVDALSAKTDKAIAAVTRQIGLLKEYRTRLISDAVTGRIDLRKL